MIEVEAEALIVKHRNDANDAQRFSKIFNRRVDILPVSFGFLDLFLL